MIVGAETSEFMVHAYQACYSGHVLNMQDEVKSEMLKVVLDDLCTAIRTLPKYEQLKFLVQVQHRLSGGN